MEIGNNGNIFGYNYSKDPIESLPLDALTIDACVHGGSNYMNLYEGNVIAHMGSDYATGGSKFNTFFRNWASRDHSEGFILSGGYVPGGPHIFYPAAVDIQMDSLFTNMVGNIMNTPIVGRPLGNPAITPFNTVRWGQNQSDSTPIDLRSKSTTAMCGNYDFFAGKYLDENGPCQGTIPPSLYRPARPSWFGNVPWPPIGPDTVSLVSKIPAQRCFENLAPSRGASYEPARCVAPNAPSNLRVASLE